MNPLQTWDLVYCVFRGKSEIGYIYGEYEDGWVFVILQDGTDLWGFSIQEQTEYLWRIKPTTVVYTFTNVMQLARDFEAGVFNPVFNSNRL